MQIDIPDQVQKTTERRKAGIVYERPTVIEALLDSELSPEDKTPPRIADEALAVVGAGVSTSPYLPTAHFLLVELHSLAIRMDEMVLSQEAHDSLTFVLE